MVAPVCRGFVKRGHDGVKGALRIELKPQLYPPGRVQPDVGDVQVLGEPFEEFICASVAVDLKDGDGVRHQPPVSARDESGAPLAAPALVSGRMGGLGCW